jgi:hypothetical protein
VLTYVSSRIISTDDYSRNRAGEWTTYSSQSTASQWVREEDRRSTRKQFSPIIRNFKGAGVGIKVSGRGESNGFALLLWRQVTEGFWVVGIRECFDCVKLKSMRRQSLWRGFPVSGWEPEKMLWLCRDQIDDEAESPARNQREKCTPLDRISDAIFSVSLKSTLDKVFCVVLKSKCCMLSRPMN